MVCGFISEKENDWLGCETEPGNIIEENYEAFSEEIKAANDGLQIIKYVSHFTGRLSLH